LMKTLLDEPEFAREQASRGLATVLARHTCAHRALEITRICEEVLGQ
jgi:spore maturation protein CgeB